MSQTVKNMKLDFLEDMTGGGKYKNVVTENLIRLYDFGPEEAKKFQDLIKYQIIEKKMEVQVDEQDFIEPLNCTLRLIIGSENEGIIWLEGNEFICKMNLEGYQYVTELVGVFTEEDSDGYHWLDADCMNDKVDFLFSPGGTW